MIKTKHILAATTLSLASLANAVTLLDFSTATASNGSLTMISTSAASPTEFLFAGIGPTGNDFIVEVYRTADGFNTAGSANGGIITGAGIQNDSSVAVGGNEWFFSFSQAVDFTVNMTSNQVQEEGGNDTQELSIITIADLPALRCKPLLGAPENLRSLAMERPPSQSEV